MEAKTLAETCGLSADLLVQIATDTDSQGRTTANLERMKQIAKTVPKAGRKRKRKRGKGGRHCPGSEVPSLWCPLERRGKGLNTMQDYDEAFNAGLITIEEYDKARERFGVAY